MIIFYPPQQTCAPIVIADMTDSSDRWSPLEIYTQALLNIPDGVVSINKPLMYSCKYSYNIQHSGIPLGAALKMTMEAAILSPPADLIAHVSVDYVSSAQSIDQMSDTLVKIANPQFKVMTAVVVERAPVSFVLRSFVAYSVVLQPDPFGATATLFIRAASFDDALIKSALGFQLDTVRPLKAQITELASSLGFACSFELGVGDNVPINGRLFQPTTLPKLLDEICLQNKIVYKIDGKIITFYAQNKEPLATVSSLYQFSFLGYAGELMWGVGIENYANVKFKTAIFNAVLFDKITLYNDNQTALFTGFKKASPRIGKLIPDSYDAFIIRYSINRNDAEICCEVTATNNWLLAQTRIDGILESKIFGSSL